MQTAAVNHNNPHEGPIQEGFELYAPFASNPNPNKQWVVDIVPIQDSPWVLQWKPRCGVMQEYGFGPGAGGVINVDQRADRGSEDG